MNVRYFLLHMQVLPTYHTRQCFQIKTKNHVPNFIHTIALVQNTAVLPYDTILWLKNS